MYLLTKLYYNYVKSWQPIHSVTKQKKTRNPVLADLEKCTLVRKGLV